MANTKVMTRTEDATDAVRASRRGLDGNGGAPKTALASANAKAAPAKTDKPKLSGS